MLPPMARRSPQASATVGVFDHWGWAVLITVAGDRVVDRRRAELVDPALPAYPHHHEAQALPVDEGVALVERVSRSAEACARAALDALASTVAMTITGLALRANPPLPATIAERLASYRARNVADSVMYRDALTRAAEARGWTVHAYDTRRVVADAARALGRTSVDDTLDRAAAALGRPWTKDHRLAMAAAIAATARA